MHTVFFRRVVLMFALALLPGVWFLSAHAASHRKPTLIKIRHAIAKDRTRVVFDLSSRTKYEIKPYSNPERIAVNLPGVGATNSIRPFEIQSGVVRRVRVNRLSWGTQVVFDLRTAAEWSDLRLAPVDDMPNRIVVDVANGESTALAPPSREVWKTAKRTSAEPKKRFIVAIDAGHGGRHPGTIGKYKLVEKNVALDISKRVTRKVNERKGFKAVMTRDRDVYLGLIERTRIAKEKDADIFVSIHLNAAPRKSARGSEVWIISPAGAEATARKLLSNRKRAADELGLDAPQSEDILHMLVGVNQQAMMEKSLLLAEELLKAMDRKGLPPIRSVKQKGFAVLKSIDMPSVLVEAGFLTNSKDASLVKNAKGRQAVAEAIAAGIVSYLTKYPPPPREDGRLVVHTVKRGDTLWGLSRTYKTTVASIRKSNKIGRSGVIHVGQELVVRKRP